MLGTEAIPMKVSRQCAVGQRLDAHFATLRSPSLRDVLKRSAGNWQIFAAVTSSALAMATGASASAIGSSAPGCATDPSASVQPARPNPASSQNVPLANAVRAAIAAQNPRARLLNRAGAATAQSGQAQTAPSIAPGGVVPLYGTSNTIQPGEWISIYGNNLAGGTATWNGDFPTLLGGTSVQIDGKAAYLMYVSPDQINLQAPDDTATGSVSVVVATGAGSATSMVTLSRFAPSFTLIDTEVPFISGIILRSDGSGAYGGGTYDILGPTGKSLGYSTVAAKAGDIVELFGVGFGPTTPFVPAGAAYSGAAAIDNPLTLYINNIVVEPAFVGLSSAGLYQINLKVPAGLGIGEVPIRAIVGGLQTQPGVLFSLHTYTGGYPGVGGGGGGTVGSAGPVFGFSSGGPIMGGTSVGGGGCGCGTGGGTGGGSGGGSGGGAGSARHARKPYEPKLRFPKK